MTTYLLAGGGTAGHVNPLLAVADAIGVHDPEAQPLVLGTKEGLEARLVPERGYELLIVDKVPFPRRIDRAALSFPRRLLRAVGQVRSIIRDRRVDVVIGFGGYAAAPAYLAASRAHVPFIVHEANAKPGMANVLGARRAAAVGVAFEGTPLRGSRVVGMPLRRELVDFDAAALRASAAAHFGLDPALPTLLVFGGSLGAARLNAAFGEARDDVLAAGWQMIHVTGERSELADPGMSGYALRRYVDRMDLAYAMADFIVSRSGAATVSEISALGIPAVYVPYAVGNGEQALNAAAAVRAGAAIIVPDGELNAERVRAQIIPLLGSDAERERMRRAAVTTGTRRGSENVIALAQEALAARARRGAGAGARA